MPYIKQGQRKWIDPPLRDLIKELQPFPEDALPGVLNYTVTCLMTAFTPANYRGYAMAVGVLETIKLELYRRRIAPFEDEKIERHGDVF